MLCISSTVDGVLTGSAAGPDGCAVNSFIALSPAEFDHFMVSPFKLSMDDASAICTAILLVWAVGFGIRLLIRLIKDSDAPSPNSID